MDSLQDAHDIQPPHQVLRKIVVPSSSRSSLVSSLPSLRDQSSEYDTPATSAAATPAESLVKKRRPQPRKGRFQEESLASDTVQSIKSRKRKRTEVHDLFEADERLAQHLQNEELVDQMPQPSRARRTPCVAIQDSDCEDEVVQSNHDVTFSEENESLCMQTRKRQDIKDRGRLPSRAARKTARKSLQCESSRLILDSEEETSSDSSNLSVFTLDAIASDALEEDEGENDGSDAGTDVGIAGAPNVNANISTNISADRPSRRRRLLQANATRRRRYTGTEDRATRERAKLVKAHPEVKTMWETLKAIERIIPAQAEQPGTITRKLKSFQLEGLDWMMKQEKSEWKGGLLGDEMGMGKTIQAVSLIMSDYPAQEPTLVVVPPGMAHCGLPCS